MKGLQIFRHSVRQVTGNLEGALRVSGVLYAVQVVIGLWIAVGWHRYVLLNEKPDLLPTFRQDRMLAYFLRSLVLGLIILLPAIVWGMVVGVLFMPFVGSGVGLVAVLLVSLIIQLPLIFLGLRLSAALPGQALGAESEVLAGWRATAHDNRALAELAVIIVAAIFVLNLIGLLVFGQSAVASLVW